MDKTSEQEPRKVNEWVVEVQIEKHLLGKVLTIIDASYQDVTQRDAVKSLVKETFHRQVDWLLQRKKEAGSTEEPAQ